MAVKATSITRMADGSVRVLVPAEVLYNVEKSQAVVRSILDRKSVV